MIPILRVSQDTSISDVEGRIMKAVSFIVFAAVLLCVNGNVSAQPFVATGSFESETICGEVSPYGSHIQKISIANPDAIQKEFTLVFKYYLNGGGVTGDPTLSLYNGIDQMFAAPFGMIEFHVEHRGDTGIATIHAQKLDIEPGGLDVNADPVEYFGLTFGSFSPFGASPAFVVDSTSSSVYGDWSFRPGTNPTWSGPASYQLAGPFPNCGPELICPTDTLYCSPCVPVNYQLLVIGCIDHQLNFDIVTGPAGASVIDASGRLLFQPTSDQVGQSFPVSLRLGEDWCGDGSYYRWTSVCDFVISVVDCYVPHFVDDQPNRFIFRTGDSLTVRMQLDDPPAPGMCVFSYYINPGDPGPPGFFVPATGAFGYQGDVADTAVYLINLIAHGATVADTASFYIYHYDTYTCGDLDHSGATNVSDLNWMVHYLFLNGPSPVTKQAGDVDCTAGITVSDLTYLVAYLFLNGLAPCVDCP